MSSEAGKTVGKPVSQLQPYLGIPGLHYVPEVMAADEQARLLAAIDQMAWQLTLRRRVQHYGFRYDYKARRVDKSMHLGALPKFAVEVAELLLSQSLIQNLPDQVIINEYLPGQGIAPHVDCVPCFGDTITTVSLGCAYEMEFTSAAKKSDKRKLLLSAGSALVMRGASRYSWLHGIRARKSDHGVARQRRVSLTFRNVLIE